jgi:hypothetical protein
VIAGVGIIPGQALAEAAGLEIENGIKTDAHGRTSDPFIWSAGSWMTGGPPRDSERSHRRATCIPLSDPSDWATAPSRSVGTSGATAPGPEAGASEEPAETSMSPEFEARRFAPRSCFAEAQTSRGSESSSFFAAVSVTLLLSDSGAPHFDQTRPPGPRELSGPELR